MSTAPRLVQEQPQEVNRPSIFSCLPTEIVRLILEHSGRDSGEMASRLIRVSSLVNTWLLPVLYETLIIKRPADLRQIRCNINLNPIDALALHVRHICLQVQTIWNVQSRAALRSEVAELLLECKNIRSMYLDTMSLPLDQDTPDRMPQLSKLHCGPGSGGTWTTHGVMAFHSLTHLRVDFSYNNGVSASWMPLLPSGGKLPNLTHLAVGSNQRSTAPELRGLTILLRGILLRPRIVMLVVTAWFCWSESDNLVSKVFTAAGGPDPRLCVLMTQGCPDELSSLKEWENAARGRRTIWEKAASVMKRKCGKERQGIAVGFL